MTDQQAQQSPGPRRWRKLGVVGAALAVMVGVGAVSANQALADTNTRATTAAVYSGAPEDLTPLTELEALEAALARVVPGGATSRDVTAMTPDGPIDLGHEMLEFVAAGGATWTVIDVDYDVAAEGSPERVSQCLAAREGCEVLTLPDGSVLQTWEEPYDYGSIGSGTNLKAERLVNGNVVRLGVVDLVEDGDASALTKDEFQAVASQPEWGQLIAAE